MSRSARRVAAVAALLAGAGALVGALATVAAFLIATTIVDGRVVGLEARFLIPASAVGVCFGAVLMPLLGFLLMRRVPLRWAFAALAAGLVVGGVPAWIIFDNSLVVQPLAGAMVAILFLILLLRLRFEVRHAVRRATI